MSSEDKHVLDVWCKTLVVFGVEHTLVEASEC